MVEIIKILVSLLGGGAFGALLTAWFQRRRARMQPIPLIERVNRLVSSDLKGFVLARRVGPDKGDGNLEAVQRVREYQFTLRNSSYIHLHNAEVLFEFPSSDIEGRAERPVRSKTTPIQVAAQVSEPWKGGFQWRIPELPPGDSIEFTFRAVDPTSDDYEAALYNGGQVVIEKSKGEPAARRLDFIPKELTIPFILGLAISSFFTFMSFKNVAERTRREATVVDWGGCNLNVSTSSEVENSKFFTLSPTGPWSLSSSIMNTGTRKCFLKWESNSGDGFTVDPGGLVDVSGGYTNTEPRLAPVGLLFGPDSPTNRATVKLYIRGKP